MINSFIFQLLILSSASAGVVNYTPNNDFNKIYWTNKEFAGYSTTKMDTLSTPFYWMNEYHFDVAKTDTWIYDTGYSVSSLSSNGTIDVMGFVNGTMVFHFVDIFNQFNNSWVGTSHYLPPVQIDTIVTVDSDMSMSTNVTTVSPVPASGSISLLLTATLITKRKRR